MLFIIDIRFSLVDIQGDLSMLTISAISAELI